MAIVTTDNQHYTDIASAIREKTGTKAQYKPSEMASGIHEVYDAGYTAGQQAGGGGDYSDIPIIEKTATGDIIILADVSEVPHKCTVSVDTDDTVWVGGKNLINHKTAVLRDGKTPLTYTDNGVIWGAGNTYFFYVYFDVPIPAGKKIYCDWQSETDSKGNYVRYWRLMNQNNTSISDAAGPKGLLTATAPVYGIQLSKYSGDVPVAEDLLISNISVTFDGAAYEPYNGKVYTVTQGQTVETDSHCMDMVLYSKNGANITFDYHKSYGMQAEYDKMWDSLQENGERTNYERAFGIVWNDQTFKPKYSLKPVNANGMLAYSQITDLQALLDEQGVTLDFSGVTYNRIVQAFMGSTITRVGVIDLSPITNAAYVFFEANKLVTIEKIVFAETNVINNNWFQSCSSLTNINEVAGVIPNSISFNWSPLSTATMKRIIAKLKNYAGTDNDGMYTVKFKDDCWTALEADSTAPDGGTWKDYVQLSLGWAI